MHSQTLSFLFKYSFLGNVHNFTYVFIFFNFPIGRSRLYRLSAKGVSTISVQLHGHLHASPSQQPTLSCPMDRQFSG